MTEENKNQIKTLSDAMRLLDALVESKNKSMSEYIQQVHDNLGIMRLDLIIDGKLSD